VKRNYNSPGKQRYQASDLVDNQSDGSLWSGKNSESFLFVNNTLKRQGDIVIIEVKKQLKEKIQSELKRAFPDQKAKKTKKAEETPAPEAANTNTQENPEKVYDKISTTVIEQMSQDYLLVRGRKEIMYKKFKRYFEIQAIVSQKDITSRDAVPSVKLLEPRINVLRY
jgi:flagellar basal body L-ring protein FlgH